MFCNGSVWLLIRVFPILWPGVIRRPRLHNAKEDIFEAASRKSSGIPYLNLLLEAIISANPLYL